MDRSARVSHKAKIISNAFSQIINRTVASVGLTSAQSHTLGYLLRRADAGLPPPCQHDIENEFQIKHPTATGILKRLSEKDFVAFVSDPLDKRLKRILITDAGLAVTLSIREEINKTDEELTAGMTEENIKELNALLDVVVKNASGKAQFTPPKGDRQA